VKQLVSTQKSY